MCIIDRYLLRHFVQTFVICFLSLMGLIVIIDVTTNLQEFVRCGTQSGVLRFIAQHYGYQSIAVFDVTSGFLALVSAMFTASWIQRHNEMTALMAAGITRIRVVLPIVVAVVVVSLLATVNRELVMPRYVNEIARKSQDPLGEHPQKLDPRYDNETGVLLAGKHTLASKKQIVEPSFLMPSRSPLAAYGTHLIADSASYVPYIASNADQSGGYLLKGVREPKNLDTLPSLLMDGHPVLITPYDAPDWLQPDQCFLKSGLDFDHLRSVADFKKLALDLATDCRTEESEPGLWGRRQGGDPRADRTAAAGPHPAVPRPAAGGYPREPQRVCRHGPVYCPQRGIHVGGIWLPGLGRKLPLDPPTIGCFGAFNDLHPRRGVVG